MVNWSTTFLWVALSMAFYLGVGVEPSIGHDCLGVGLGKSVADHLEGLHDVAREQVQVLHVVRPRPEAEHGVDVGSGVHDVPPVVEHGLPEEGPCFRVFRGVENFPAGHDPSGVAEESCCGIAEGGSIGPTKGNPHSVYSYTPGQDIHGVLVPLAMEDGDLLLVDLEDWSIGSGDDWQDVVSRGGGGGVGGGPMAIAG